MSLSSRSDVEAAVEELFRAERTARKLSEEIAEGPKDLALDVLTAAIVTARARTDERDRVLELESIAHILGQVTGAGAVDALIDILGSEEPAARHAAGVSLEDLAFDRFKEVALGVERALAQLPHDHLALTELPYLLVELPEPGVSKLLHRFLEHPNEQVVAAGIEACVELGDPSSAPRLAKLEKDTRLVEIEDHDHDHEGHDHDHDHDHDATITLGELAKEARLTLEAFGSEDRP